MQQMEPYLWSTVAVVVLLASLANLLLYGLDKRRSRRDEWRVPEKTFHILGLFGGWPGAWIGGFLFRHKTKKLSYRLVFFLVVIVNCGFVWLLWRLARSVDAG